MHCVNRIERKLSLLFLKIQLSMKLELTSSEESTKFLVIKELASGVSRKKWIESEI